MTAGALYQLGLNSNAENNFLDFDPQITFFKVVYRKHTRFCMENIELDPINRHQLDFNETTVMQCNIPRNGDLLKNIYLTFTLPDIYSGNYTSDNSNYFNYEFRWIENIGINIFNYISFKMSDQEIDKIYSDYYYIWKELTLSDEKKGVLNEMIGNVKEIYDPASVPDNANTYPSITTGSNSSDISTRWTRIKNNQIILFSEISSATYPSIKSRKIRVPLNLWFCNDIGLALPLIALQYSKSSIELEMKAFRDLYTIKYVDASDSSLRITRIKPSDSSIHNMSNFADNYTFNITPKLEGEFIFLDDEERRRFALNDHDYLIKQSRITIPTGTSIPSSENISEIKLSAAFNPVSHLAWVIKRDDMPEYNDWNNYTNWVYPSTPPNSKNYTDLEKKYNIKKTQYAFYTDLTSLTHKKYYTPTAFKKHILTNVRLEFDGVNRINKAAEYFNSSQIYQHWKTNPDKGIYVYSFSLNPDDYQPSGSCNFSLVNNAKLYFSKDVVDDFTFYNYKAYVYIISYNILSITNGLGNVKFSN